MKKFTREKVVVKRETVTEEVFVASDGLEFDSETECEAYEELLDRVEALETESLGRPLDCDLGEDYWGFNWYKVQSEDDMKVLEKYYRTEFGEGTCRDAVQDGIACIADPVCREHGEPQVFTMTSMIQLATGFFKEAGYHTEIRKNRVS